MATVLKSERGTPYYKTFIDLYQYSSVENGGMAVFRLRITALSEYCRSNGRI